MLTSDERLALLTVIDKKVAPELKAAKNAACFELMERCEEDGTDRRAVLVDGTKVGTIGVSYSKAHPVITDMQGALECLRDMGLTEEVPVKGWEEYFTVVGGCVVAKDTAEAADWAVWEPQRPKNASVRITDPQSVLDAFGPRLQGNPLALLEESND